MQPQIIEAMSATTAKLAAMIMRFMVVFGGLGLKTDQSNCPRLPATNNLDFQCSYLYYSIFKSACQVFRATKKRRFNPPLFLFKSYLIVTFAPAAANFFSISAASSFLTPSFTI